jgi:hypothetical protein
MAQVWQRLADDYAASTLSLTPPRIGAEQRPAMQQQQQIQPKDDSKND